ncbi:MAG: hypothetical protein WA005_12425 [Candidatus Binataceae bacterium]
MSLIDQSARNSAVKWVNRGWSAAVGLVVLAISGFLLRVVLVWIDCWLRARAELPRYGSLAILGGIVLMLYLCWQTGEECRTYLAAHRSERAERSATREGRRPVDR